MEAQITWLDRLAHAALGAVLIVAGMLIMEIGMAKVGDPLLSALARLVSLVRIAVALTHR